MRAKPLCTPPLWAIALAMAVMSLAGCSGDHEADAAPRERPWEPLPCDGTEAMTIGVTAEPVEGLRGGPATVAKRVASAFGERLVGTPREELSPYTDARGQAKSTLKTTWETGTGQLIVQSTEGAIILLELVRGQPFPDDAVEAWVPGLGVDTATLVQTDPFPDSAATSGRLDQWWSGRPVGVGLDPLFGIAWGGGASLLEGNASLVLGQLFDFLIVEPVVPEAAAFGAATSFSACHVAARGWTADNGFGQGQAVNLGVAVWEGSLAYLVHIAYDAPVEAMQDLECGPRHWVYVDVITKAIVMAIDPPCSTPAPAT